MSDDMNEKYQQHYNQIIVGTLTDTMMKNISYQANIKLANEIIAEQEKQIEDLNLDKTKFQKDIEDLKNGKITSENSKIAMLENTIKTQQSTISKLNSDIMEFNKIKLEYNDIKHQVQHIETFRNQLIQSQRIIEEKDLEIKKLNEKIDYLQLTPAKRKKIDDMNKQVEEQPQSNESSLETIIKDGGSF